jgi:capsular polysaccharide biosynthesis protein
MQDDLTESEREQLRKFVVLQKVAGIILLKWIWLLLAVFFALAAGFSLFVVKHYSKSIRRFDAKTQLLYNPRQVAKVQNVTDKQLMSILDRASIRRKMGDRMAMTESEKECLVQDLEIRQERRQPNLFILTAHAPTKAGAVEKVNLYAEMLIGEYVTYRNRDLETWRESLEVRKKSLLGNIAELEGEESVLKGKAGVAAPAEMLTMTTGLLSDQRRNLSLLSVKINNEELKKKSIEAVVGKMGEAVSANAATIRRKSRELAELDKEIAKLREIYTDLNPKVKGRLEDRQKMLADYNEFLKSKGIDGVDLDTLAQTEKAASDLAESMMCLNVLKEDYHSLEQEIKSNEKLAERLTAVIPAFERLRVKRADLERAMNDLDEQIGNLAYLQSAARSDLKQIERAGGAADMNPRRPRNFILAIAAAVVCTLLLAAWILVFEFLFGKVTGGRELKARNEITFIGSLPKPGCVNEGEERDVLGVVALNFSSAQMPKGIVLECRLPGAEMQPKFGEVLVWSLAMAGSRSFVLEIVPHFGFTPPENGESMLNTVRCGDTGWFPVDNRYALAPTEVQMLKADLEGIRQEYEHVFLRMPDGFRRGGSFLDQLLDLSDCALVMVGAGNTSRSALSYALRHVQAKQKPVLGLAVGATAKVVRKEMEAKK